MNPEIPVKAIQEQMQKKFHVAVSKTKAFKAKAQVHLKGDVIAKYFFLRDYVSKLQRCNPDTTVKIDVYMEEDPEKTTRMFRRIYVFLRALKRGFKEGGRELLGLDGAFMRGQYPGQMLTAVGLDANNYLVAYGLWNQRTNTLGHGHNKRGCKANVLSDGGKRDTLPNTTVPRKLWEQKDLQDILQIKLSTTKNNNVNQVILQMKLQQKGHKLLQDQVSREQR
ncbi:hypothetical protein Tco_0445835 [Tanacetum coccineum]